MFATEAVLQIETINFMKLPPGLQGLKVLQLALHELLGTIGKANYFTTTRTRQVSSALPAKPAGRTFSKGSTTPSRPSQATPLIKQRTTSTSRTRTAYTFHDDTTFVTWWTTLLLLETAQIIKASLGRESVCCLLVLNLVSSTLPCVRRSSRQA